MTRVTRRALSTLTALVMVGTLFLGAPSPAYAASYYWVSQSGSAGSGTGCTNADFVGFDETPIAAAVTAASDGDTIHICSGTYVIANTIDLAGETITLLGDPDAAPTVLDGGDTTRILTSSGAITVSNLTFKDGYGVLGGAIYADTSVTVTNSRFTSNDADFGGAIYADTATVTNSRFTSNDAATAGGAIAADGSATVTRSTFTSNDADFGGAIAADGSATVTDSTFTSNDAATAGGAIAAVGATVTRSTFMGNTAAADGGAIYAETVANVTRSTFTGNTADVDGGAIYADTATVTNSRFTSNDADFGGAIFALTLTVTDSRFTSNDATSDGGAILANTGTIARSRFIRNTAGGHGGAVHLWTPNSDNLQQLRRNTFTRNRADAGGAIVLGSCGPVDPGAAKAARVERANSFSGNRATVKRRTNNIETGYCGD
ncbi:MAG: hypothetical protein RIQ87_319 [Chloroflexota bacterium]|jgi:predicted outer membrane repeat protein